MYYHNPVIQTHKTKYDSECVCAAKVYVQVGESSTYFTLRDTAVVN